MKTFDLFIVFLGRLIGHLGYCNILHTQEDYFPARWSEICKAQMTDGILDHVVIKCEPSALDSIQLSMDQLRAWTSTRRSNFTYIYDVRCKHGGNISLPWPMKSPKMVGLYVRGCTVLDIFADFGNTAVESLPDEFKVIDVRHVVMKIKIATLLSTIRKIRNISDDYNCGHDKSLETIVFRNVSYQLDYSNIGSIFSKMRAVTAMTTSTVKQTTRTGKSVTVSSASKMLTPIVNTTNAPPATTKAVQATGLLGFTDMLENMLRLQTQCQYDDLKSLDESISDTLSVYHHQFLVKGSRYPELVFLNYSFNNINVIPEPLLQWRLYFPKLKRLDISHNYISEANFKFFPTRQSEVTYIDMRFNNITQLKAEDVIKWAIIPKLFIDIRNNPIHCGCELASFITFLGNTSFYGGKGVKYNYIKNMTCASPSNIVGKVLGTLDVAALPCPRYSNFLIPLITVGIIALLLLILLILTVKYRREIRILFFTRFHILLPGDLADLENNKTYDAFVSYSSADDDWVIDTLCAKLENIELPKRFANKSAHSDVYKMQSRDPSKQNGVVSKDKSKQGQTLRLCLHHRDFVPGLSITDNILNSIEASRHTIIVVSRNFVNSEWALEEFRQAYHQSIIEKRRHLIILIYEHIPDRDMDPLLKRCFKMFTYLDVSDRLFWDRIIYSLSTKQKLQKEKRSTDSIKGLAYTSVFDIESDAQKQNHTMRQFSTSSSSTDVTVVSELSDCDSSFKEVDIKFRP